MLQDSFSVLVIVMIAAPSALVMPNMLVRTPLIVAGSSYDGRERTSASAGVRARQVPTVGALCGLARRLPL